MSEAHEEAKRWIASAEAFSKPQSDRALESAGRIVAAASRTIRNGE